MDQIVLGDEYRDVFAEVTETAVARCELLHDASAIQLVLKLDKDGKYKNQSG